MDSSEICTSKTTSRDPMEGVIDTVFRRDLGPRLSSRLWMGIASIYQPISQLPDETSMGRNEDMEPIASRRDSL